MRKVALIFIAMGMLLFGGCSDITADHIKKEANDKTENVADKDNEYVAMVKNGNPVDYPDKTFGNCFENFFGSPTWKHFESDEEVNVVEFTGECTYQEVPVKARIQFIIAADGGSFEVGYLSFNEVPQDMLTTTALLSTAFDSYTSAPQGETNSEKGEAHNASQINETDEPVGYISFNNVKASSELAESKQADYIAQNTRDSVKETAWVEGRSGNGIGEWILFADNSQKEISAIEILSGYHKNKDLYLKNNRVKKIGIEFSDGSYIESALEDSFGMSNTITLEQPVKTSSVKLTILDVYGGTKYQDTCISEIDFIGR
ncbi:MAG: hypothetical protein GT589_01020 [Peptoclostridium sp.]|uniref:NADase-type glycan-binding domain-containing protein n=1 Tax=Peptoclostridium sp. TaxID=1904860 RepID=UPI00139AD688|nr:hypothetical protein [Peptoclostridium sp.]MZQ74725.1 hypothetical protein [Peptoclostridium sp.]